MNQNRRYLIFTGESTEKERPYNHTWWRQEEPAPNAEPNMVELTIPHPITADIYYSACGQSDRHNRWLQESLDIRKNWVLKIGRSGSTYLILRWMWLMSGWHIKASLGRRRPKLISTIICMKIWYITTKIGSWYGVQRGGGGKFLTLMMELSWITTHCLAGPMVLPDVELLYMSPPLRRRGRRGVG